MIKQSRLEQILEMVRADRSVEVGQLCSHFSVTEMTIRRDLDELAQKGLLVRTHGGAVASESNTLSEKPFEMRLISYYEQKDAIACLALSLLPEGSKIFMNSSSTVFCLAKRLDTTRPFLIATEATNIANELNARPNVTVIQIGGELRKNTISCVGHFAESMIRQFRFDLAVLGINAIDAQGNLYCGSSHEVGIYKAAFSVAQRVIILADASKLGRMDFAQVGCADDFSCLVTDSQARADLVSHYRELNIDVHVAPIGNAESPKPKEGS